MNLIGSITTDIQTNEHFPITKGDGDMLLYSGTYNVGCEVESDGFSYYLWPVEWGVENYIDAWVYYKSTYMEIVSVITEFIEDNFPYNKILNWVK